MSQKLRWGIVSTGAIAGAFAHGLTQSKTGQLVAVGSRSRESAEEFADRFGLSPDTAFDSYEAMLADPSVEAVYVATPHPLHPEWAIKAAEAGKHVLCEKPLALNRALAVAMFEAARANGVFMMEAFMYRCHPQIARLLEIIRSGRIGEIRMIQATFGFRAGPDPTSRILNNALGGGGILDVGCYPVSFARLIAGAAVGEPFQNPLKVQAAGHVGETGVDEYAAAVLSFPGDIVAQVATGVRLGLENVARIYGSEGWILVETPWGASRENPTDGRFIVHAGGCEAIAVPAERTSFAYEADVVAEAVFAGQTEPTAPAMTRADTLENLQALDAWRAALGVVYEAETPEGSPCSVANRPLQVRPDHPMRYGRVPGLDRDISRFIMGCDNQATYSGAQVLYDAWTECGGNAFDTSYVYGGGAHEKLLGKWIKARGMADEVMVTVKGAHTPRCTPELLLQDFNTSLERLQLDKTAIYIMHRDNPEVPVGEFVDVLNALKEEGRIEVFGGSNWTFERFAEANAYAAREGKQGMSILNNNLSIAHMVREVWPGCQHLSDAASRERLTQEQTVVFSWSSQARGYFLPDSDYKKLGPDNFLCWDSPDNRIRRERAFELAERRGVSGINIAAAYVLCQPFPAFALIGPRDVHELATCLPALGLELTAEELAYLSLDSDLAPA